MRTTLGLSDGFVSTGLTVPGVPTSPTTVPLPTTIDGNVLAPPNVTPSNPDGTTPVVAPPVPAMPAPEPTFWDNYGEAITGVFAIIGAITVIELIRKGRILWQSGRSQV